MLCFKIKPKQKTNRIQKGWGEGQNGKQLLFKVFSEIGYMLDYIGLDKH